MNKHRFGTFWRLVMDGRRPAFSLVEMLVVTAIISLLFGLLLPAVQASREVSRRATCTNNLHNHVLALSDYHVAHNQLPPGRTFGVKFGKELSLEKFVDHSWAAHVLPFIDQPALYQTIDFRVPWRAAKNSAAASTTLTIFRCPSSDLEFTGDSDYSGMTGTLMDTTPDDGVDDADPFNRGVLIAADYLRDGIHFGQVTDGLSTTLAVAECSDITEEEQGLWISGVNVLSHDRSNVNSSREGIFSWHPGGAHAARADGSVSFLSESIAPHVLGSLCTRATGDMAVP
jgi:prepilin-type N-terminal cleavage/methylation domain-containing protein